MKTLKANKLQRILWRLRFRKVKWTYAFGNEGRCVKCDAGNPKVECSYYYCPCKMNEQLRRIL